MNTSATIILLISTVVLGSCNAEADQKLQKAHPALAQDQKQKILHEGISLGLLTVLEDDKDYRIDNMTKTGKKPYKGIVIAKSGNQYNASCTISTVSKIHYITPCHLQITLPSTPLKGAEK